MYKEIPHFQPEVFALLHNPNPSNFKKFREGLDQLLQEGVVQGFYARSAHQRTPILAAVGPLQFEVVQYRLQSEYGAESRLEQTEWKMLRWIHPATDMDMLSKRTLPTGSVLAINDEGQTVLLFTGEWAVNFFTKKNPEIKLSELPFAMGEE